MSTFISYLQAAALDFSWLGAVQLVFGLALAAALLVLFKPLLRGIARALLLRPSVLLIDEPSIGLSPKVSQAVFRLLRGLADAGASVLMVEQNVRSALAVSDRVLVLEGGRLVQACPAAELIADPNLNRVFLGRHAAP